MPKNQNLVPRDLFFCGSFFFARHHEAGRIFASPPPPSMLMPILASPSRPPPPLVGHDHLPASRQRQVKSRESWHNHWILTILGITPELTEPYCFRYKSPVSKWTLSVFSVPLF